MGHRRAFFFFLSFRIAVELDHVRYEIARTVVLACLRLKVVGASPLASGGMGFESPSRYRAKATF